MVASENNIRRFGNNTTMTLLTPQIRQLVDSFRKENKISPAAEILLKS